MIVTPGPIVALIVGTSLRHGARTGLMAMAGVNAGVMIQLAVVAAGLAWIVDLFARNFEVDPLYRRGLSPVCLGVQTLWRARGAVAGVPVAPLSANRAFARGFVVAFTNPKTIVFQRRSCRSSSTDGEREERTALCCSRGPSGSSRSRCDAIWVLCAARLKAAVSSAARN